MQILGLVLPVTPIQIAGLSFRDKKYFREKFVFQLAFLDWKQVLALQKFNMGTGTSPNYICVKLCFNYSKKYET